MIDEVIKMKQNKNIVSIFCDETDSTTFLEGYIYAVHGKGTFCSEMGRHTKTYYKRIRQYCAFGDRRKIRKKNRKIIS